MTTSEVKFVLEEAANNRTLQFFLQDEGGNLVPLKLLSATEEVQGITQYPEPKYLSVVLGE